MSAHDPYVVKALEYLLAVAFVGLFVVFWRFVNGGRAAEAHAHAGSFSEWFRMPERLYFHPGHAWVRPEQEGVVTIGLDDFAQHLVGSIYEVDLPQQGALIHTGAPAWAVRANGRSIDMLAPVSGRVVAVNAAVKQKAGLVNRDPYGAGWLLKVQAPKLSSALRDLLTGEAARRWIENATRALFRTMSPALGEMAQDGGLPVHGIARAIDEDRWDEIARRFLLTEEASHERQQA